MNEPAIRTEEQVISLFPDREGALGAKNNDSLSEKWVIVKFYTLKNQKCSNPNY